MRIADVFRLALGALWQQKARTILTTLGVIFGSLVLVISLSIGQGVQETILREASKYGDLRKIIVHPRSRPITTDTPLKPVEVHGKMSEERRRRLQQTLTGRLGSSRPREPQTPLTPERVRALEELAHVRSAVPGGYRRAWARLNGRTASGQAQAVLPDNDVLRERLLAGELFEDADAHEVVVTDLLLYQLGVADDADLEGVIGKTLHLEFFDPDAPAEVVLNTQAANEAGLTEAETNRVGDVLKRLPGELDRLDLKPDEKAALRKLLDRRKQPRQGPSSLELTIRGVVRHSDEGTHGLRYFENLTGDLFVPPRTLDSFLGPLGGQVGFDWVVLEVDDRDSVKPLTVLLQMMGFNPDSLVARIEQERFTYLLIFGGMTIVAGVALLVAALGITNTMLISVLERIREIGVMKALGAKDRHIQSIFLVEGAVIGLLGGLLGLWLAWGVSGPCDSWLRGMLASGTTIKLEHSIFVFPLWLLLAAPAFACLVTTLAAVYPARHAARVDPVTALRHE